MELKLATAEMLHDRLGYMPLTVRALCAVEGDRVLGAAGIYSRPDGLVMFSDVDPEVWARPRLIVRAYRQLLEWAKETRLPVHTLCDPEIEAAKRFLEHLGFKPLCGDIYQWKAE